MECKTNDLLLRLEYGREVIAQESLGGDCRGVCTPGEKEEGEKRLAKLRERIERDEASGSELDYNFVDCQSFTPRFLGVPGGFDRPLLFVSTEHLAHHDVVTDFVHAVGVTCGTIAVSDDHEDPGGPRHNEDHFTRAEARRSTRDGAFEGTFDIVVREQAPGAENDALQGWKTVARLQDLGCGWELELASPEHLSPTAVATQGQGVGARAAGRAPGRELEAIRDDRARGPRALVHLLRHAVDIQGDHSHGPVHHGCHVTPDVVPATCARRRGRSPRTRDAGTGSGPRPARRPTSRRWPGSAGGSGAC